MAEGLRWDLAAAVTALPEQASHARLWVESGCAVLGAVGLLVNFLFGSWALAIASVCCALVGLGLRFMRTGEDGDVRSCVRTYLAGMLVFFVGVALASVFGPAAFMASFLGTYLMLSAQTRSRSVLGGEPQP